LTELIDPATRGDPQSPLQWVTLSTRTLAEQLTASGHRVSRMTMDRLLHQLGFSLQSNRKSREGAQHPDRDGQFRFINDRSTEFLACGDPVLSVDAKKKEILANYKSAGQRWEPVGDPTRVDSHDFPFPRLGRALPYGVYDVAANHGFVSVGVSHNTAAFAAAGVRAWWDLEGRGRYGQCTRILLTADSGGANGRSSRLWKFELTRFARDIGRPVYVCHYPAGTSKWNRIEHRLFAPISVGMRARPPVDLATVVGVIGATTTRTGLDVTVRLDIADYPTGTKISNRQMKSLPLTGEDWHPEWNYRLDPTPP
jgi:hypothetical protein